MSQIASIPTSSLSPVCSQARAGTFMLCSGVAMSLKPRQASILRINCGTAWVTEQRTGIDHLLNANDQLQLESGDHVVIESLHAGHVKLDWQAVAQSAERSSLRESASEATAANRLANQALRDLRGAAVLLARGLAGGLKALVLALALIAHSNARAAQGRMAS